MPAYQVDFVPFSPDEGRGRHALAIQSAMNSVARQGWHVHSVTLLHADEGAFVTFETPPELDR